MSANKVLICTVGGSHEPIVTALRNGRPDHVIFVCSEKDPATGRPGSEEQILRPDNIIKARPDDAKPTLPNIPAQAGLPQEQFEVLLVPADDLDAAFAAIHTALHGLRSRFPDAHVIADYTGGTKTMSSALVIAALESGIELQLVTGSRRPRENCGRLRRKSALGSRRWANGAHGYRRGYFAIALRRRRTPTGNGGRPRAWKEKASHDRAGFHPPRDVGRRDRSGARFGSTTNLRWMSY